jgi:hypothetical protein
LKRVQIIDINGIKHAAEYLNSSKVKYNDDVIDTVILTVPILY